MIAAVVAVTVAWQKLLVCGLPEAFTSPTVVRYGDMPLLRMSGKALNCNLIHEVGAIPAWAGPGSAVSGFASESAGLSPRRARPATSPVNSELTDSSLEIRVIVAARS